MITVSIVSHAHGNMVCGLVQALLDCPEVESILVTLNVPESLPLPTDSRISIIRNDVPKGFGANHNAAFAHCHTSFFCPLNPDITLMANPFPGLLDSIASTKSALVAPLVLAPGGLIEDSARRFPNFRRLITRLFSEQGPDYPLAQEQSPVFPDWVAGMFMLFRADDFARLRGFDEGFHLYYEDVDICVRAWKMGRPVSVCPQVSVIHDAQRTSRRNLRYMRWHLTSMARYLVKHWGRLPVIQVK